MRAQATFLRNRPRAAVFAAAAVLAVGAALAGAGAARSAAGGPVPELPAPSASGFADLVERVQPAVVVVTVEKRAPEAMQFSPPSPFENMPPRFGPFFDRPPFGAPGPQRHTGSGSGFFVDARGHVVTSDHVVAGAEEITVTLHDGTRREARVVGRDPRTDLAVLKIDGAGGRERSWLAFGDEDGTRVGDWVVAVGNPFGLGGTVTAGILSARGRDIRLGGYGDFLQVDAPINRGNSGGPLFDARGRVIGVNAAIYAPSGGNVGIGFAVPASLAGPVVAKLIEDGKVSRGWLGISIQPLSPEIARSLGMPEETSDGALVVQVEPDSPAARAGIEEADVVTAVDSRPVENGTALARAIGSMKPGDGVVLTVHRGGGSLEVEVDLAGWPDEGDMAIAGTLGAPEPASGPRLGVLLSDHEGQLVIDEVYPGTPAAEAGLLPGDVLLGIDREAVQDRDGVRQALREASEDGREFALVRIRRQGEPRFVAVRVEGA